MPNLYLKPEYLKMVTDTIATVCPHATIVAYGSRVDGDDQSVHGGTDLDLAVLDFGESDGGIVDLRAAFSESNIPILIDVFDYQLLPESFREEIDRNNYLICGGERE